MDKRVNKIIDLIENTVDEVSLDTLQSYREKRLKEPLDKRTPTKTKGIQRSYTKMMYKINKDDKGTFGDNKGYDQGRYMGDSVEDVEEVEGSEGEIDEASIRDAERALSQHAQRKIDHENKYGPMSPSDLVTHEKTRKLLLTKKVAAQRAYNKRVNNESMVARVQGGRKMVSAEAALRHARELAQKRQPGSKPTLSDIAHAHRNLTSGIKHESEENESIDESFAVKDSSGKTVDVKFSESEAKKRAEELSKKTGQKHSVKFERTAMVRTVEEDTDGKDTVTLEIPALIRALEWAREDAEDDVEIHKFVEKLINHEGTVDMEFFSEDIVPSADRKVDKNGRPYPAHLVQVGTNESRKMSPTVVNKNLPNHQKNHEETTLRIIGQPHVNPIKLSNRNKEGTKATLSHNGLHHDAVKSHNGKWYLTGDYVKESVDRLPHLGEIFQDPFPGWVIVDDILSTRGDLLGHILKNSSGYAFYDDREQTIHDGYSTILDAKRSFNKVSKGKFSSIARIVNKNLPNHQKKHEETTLQNTGQPNINESVDHLPQEAVGKSNKKIAEMLADELKRVGIKLIKADPFPGQKGTIWSVESSQYPDQVVTLEWSARTPGGRGINKEKNINLSFELYNKDGTRFEPTRMNKLNSIAAITFDGIGKIYKERVL